MKIRTKDHAKILKVIYYKTAFKEVNSRANAVLLVSPTKALSLSGFSNSDTNICHMIAPRASNS